MPLDEMLDDQQNKYQDIGGYRLPVPGAMGKGGNPGDDVGFQPRPDPTNDTSMVPHPSIASSSPKGGMADTRSLAPSAPSISEVMGGKPAAPAAAPAAPSTDINHDEILKQIMGGTGTQAPPPTSTDNLSSLISQRATAGRPLDTHDPKYQMGKPMKVLQTIGNFASGFGGSHREPTYVGPGATNHRFSVDTATQAKTEKNLDTQIGSTEKLNDETQKAYGTALKQSYESRLNDTREETAQARKTAAQAQVDKAAAQQDLTDQKNRQITYDSKTKRFLQNGKVYVPKSIEEGASLEAAYNINGNYTARWETEKKNRGSQRQPTELELWREQFHKENGRDPSADEIVTRHRAPDKPTFKDKEAVDKESDSWYAKSRGDVAKQKNEWKRLNPDASTEEEQAQYKQIEDDYAGKAKDFEGRKKGYYEQAAQSGARRGGGRPAPAAAAAPSAAPATQTNYKMTAKSKDGNQRIGSNDGKSWFDVTTGKPFNAGGR